MPIAGQHLPGKNLPFRVFGKDGGKPFAAQILRQPRRSGAGARKQQHTGAIFPVALQVLSARIREQAEAVELEFRESMSHRAEKGYVLPEQMRVLYGVEETAAVIQGIPFVTLSAMEPKSTMFKVQRRFDIPARSIIPPDLTYPEIPAPALSAPLCGRQSCALPPSEIFP